MGWLGTAEDATAAAESAMAQKVILRALQARTDREGPEEHFSKLGKWATGRPVKCCTAVSGVQTGAKPLHWKYVQMGV